MTKPEASTSLAKIELDKAQKQFDAHDEHVKNLTLDRMNKAPRQEQEPQTKLSQSDLAKAKDVYLKPVKQIGSHEKFNENYRDDYNFAMEMVRFVAENKEIIGEAIELWTKPFPGMPAQFWIVPVNKPVWGPRHLAERLSGCRYHKLTMEQSTITGQDGLGTYHGGVTVDSVVNRIDAHPATERKSIFFGENKF